MNALKRRIFSWIGKALSDMAIRDMAGFEKLVGVAKQQLATAAS